MILYTSNVSFVSSFEAVKVLRVLALGVFSGRKLDLNNTIILYKIIWKI